MSIASRISFIEEHLEDAYDAIEAKGANLHLLPSEYTQVDYIECSGTQYIDTNYIIKNEPKVETEILVNLIDNQDIFGMDNRTNNVLILNFDNNNISCRYGTYTSKKISATGMMNKWIKISYSKEVYIDNILKTSFDAYDFSDNTLTFRVGRARSGVYSKSKYKYLKLYDNNVLVRDFIPCYRNSDSEVGLYDLVNDTFYTNQGTGTFTYGEVKEDYAFAKNISNLSRAINLIPTD